jgi:hypothetical protein
MDAWGYCLPLPKIDMKPGEAIAWEINNEWKNESNDKKATIERAWFTCQELNGAARASFCFNGLTESGKVTMSGDSIVVTTNGYRR